MTEKSDQILFKPNLFVSQNEDLNILISIHRKNSISEYINNLLTIENSYVIVCAKRVRQQFLRYSMNSCSPTLDEQKNLFCECPLNSQQYIAIVIAAFWALFACLLNKMRQTFNE